MLTNCSLWTVTRVTAIPATPPLPPLCPTVAPAGPRTLSCPLPWGMAVIASHCQWYALQAVWRTRSSFRIAMTCPVATQVRNWWPTPLMVEVVVLEVLVVAVAVDQQALL